MAEEDVLWRWFALHSGQRMQLVSFWLASTALLVSGLVTAVDGGLTHFAVGLCALGALSSISFALLDRRTRGLIQIAERLAKQELIEGEPTQFAALVVSAASGHRRVESYRFVIQGLELSTGIMFVVALAWLLALP